ncbi:unnamed protein product, partial [Polarella glacialis]
MAMEQWMVPGTSSASVGAGPRRANSPAATPAGPRRPGRLAWGEAIALLCEMHRAGPEPSVITYSGAVSACLRGQQWSLGLGLLVQSLGRGLRPDLLLYSAAASALRVGRCWAE